VTKGCCVNLTASPLTGGAEYKGVAIFDHADGDFCDSHCIRTSIVQACLANAALNDVDLMDRFVAVYNNFTGAEDVANDVHTQLTDEIIGHVLKQRHLHQHAPQAHALATYHSTSTISKQVSI